jgi:hypothetical protein
MRSLFFGEIQHVHLINIRRVVLYAQREHHPRNGCASDWTTETQAPFQIATLPKRMRDRDRA